MKLPLLLQRRNFSQPKFGSSQVPFPQTFPSPWQLGGTALNRQFAQGCPVFGAEGVHQRWHGQFLASWPQRSAEFPGVDEAFLSVTVQSLRYVEYTS